MTTDLAQSIANTITQNIQDNNVRFVRFIWCDNANVIRAKAVHISHLADFLTGGHGVGIAAAQMALPVMYDALVAGAGLTPAGEVHMHADWATFQPLPYTPGHARVFTDIMDAAGQPWAHCPRTFLRTMIARAAELGLQITAAFENEFSLLKVHNENNLGQWLPFDNTVFCQTSALDMAGPILNDITTTLDAQGLVVEMAYAEAGPGQFELPNRYADALRAADNQIVFRETVRAVARQHGVLASFVPKIYPDKAGNGTHLHFSLIRDGRNLAVNPKTNRPTPEMAAFIAGVLHHLPALAALSIPSTNSYKRIRPHFWSGAYTCWGVGNREAAVRAPQPSHGKPITNFELKTSDASANPYLALGALIAAGLDGMAKGLNPGDPVTSDPADLSEAEREARGIRRLPTSLGEAVEALERDQVLLDALGPERAATYIAVRKAEWQAMKDLSHEDEVRLLLERY